MLPLTQRTTTEQIRKWRKKNEVNERLENKMERLNGLMVVSGCLGNIICCEVISFLFCDRSRDARLLHGKKTDLSLKGIE